MQQGTPSAGQSRRDFVAPGCVPLEGGGALRGRQGLPRSRATPGFQHPEELVPQGWGLLLRGCLPLDPLSVGGSTAAWATLSWASLRRQRSHDVVAGGPV